MQTYFADTWFWVALINKRDPYHAQAHRISDDIGDEPIFTSHMVFVEVMGHFTKGGEMLRRLAVQTFNGLRLKDTVTIVPQTPEQFEAATRRYLQYKDKEWSLTDCASMIIMEANNISIAITDDHHFEQAKYQIRNT